MTFKIRTSGNTAKYFEEMEASTNYPPYILSKMAISMSLKSNAPLTNGDFQTDAFGLELNRQTITGEWDLLYKCLIEMFEKVHLSDEDYFQKYLKAHLDRGARLLYSEFRYNNDFLSAILSQEKTI